MFAKPYCEIQVNHSKSYTTWYLEQGFPSPSANSKTYMLWPQASMPIMMGLTTSQLAVSYVDEHSWIMNV